MRKPQNIILSAFSIAVCMIGCTNYQSILDSDTVLRERNPWGFISLGDDYKSMEDDYSPSARDIEVDYLHTSDIQISATDAMRSRAQETFPNGDLQHFWPWPPPQASTIYRYPASFLRDGELQTIGEAAEYFEKRLRDASYSRFSYFYAPGGFALATQIEKINSDGSRSESGDRWVPYTEKHVNSLYQYFLSLVKGKTGDYRMFSIVVTNDPSREQEVGASISLLQNWSSSGLKFLPDWYRYASIEKGSVAYILVYEVKIRGSEEPKVTTTSAISGLRHAESVGLQYEQ